MPASIQPTSPTAPFDLAGHVALVEAELARARVCAGRRQVPQLLRWAEPLGERT